MPRMDMMSILKNYIEDYNIILGYTGSVGFWIMEYHEKLGGMILTACMVITSIVLQAWKIHAVVAEERRKEERHRQEMQQDQERHQKDINNTEHGNA